MEINNNNPVNPPQGSSQLKAAAHTWQVGQLLKGVVIENLQNSVKLRIDNTLVQAPTSKQHTQGETLLMTVMRAGDKPVLRVAAPQAASTHSSQLLQESSLKVLLPRQVPLTSLLANLSAITQLKTQLASPLPSEITQSVKKLLDNMTSSAQAGNPKTLQRAILDSGVLLEKKLANLAQTATGGNNRRGAGTASPLTANTSAASIAQDFKGNLLQLLDQLRQLPRENSDPTRLVVPQQLPTKGEIPGAINNPGQAQNRAQTLPQTVKENLLRLLTTQTNSTTPSDEAAPTAASPRSSLLTATLNRLPLPFFRHMPLQPQKAQQPSLVLLQQREQIIDEMIRLVEGSVARVQLSQLASLPQSDTPQPSWTLELPLRHGQHADVVQMRIEQEAPQQGEEQEKRWRVTLTLDLPEIGTLYATITIQGESSSTTLWAEHADTAALIENHLEILHHAIEAHGVKVNEIRCQHGTPPHSPHHQRHSLLVDTKV